MTLDELYVYVDRLPNMPTRPGQTIGCKIWYYHKIPKGYPSVRIDGDVTGVVTAVLSRKLGRPIKKGMYCCHKCDVKQCVEPEHLYEGTPQDNNMDARIRHTTSLSIIGHVSCRGEKHGRSKLKDSDVLAIREAAAAGATYHALSGVYGVKELQIQRIVKRESWRHLPDRAPAEAGA